MFLKKTSYTTFPNLTHLDMLENNKNSEQRYSENYFHWLPSTLTYLNLQFTPMNYIKLVNLLNLR